MNFSIAQIKVDPAQCLNTGKVFREPNGTDGNSRLLIDLFHHVPLAVTRRPPSDRTARHAKQSSFS
jgi:hypothetical protein